MADAKTWKPLELIKVTADYLATKNIPSPRLDAEVLLCAALGLQRRVDLYAGFETEIAGGKLTEYRKLVRRRALREPVSRILGKREFMGISFLVTPDVLSPRPETELLVEGVLECVRPKKNVLPAEEETAITPPVVEEEDSGLLDQLLDSYGEDVDDEKDIDAEPAVRAPAVKKPVPRPAAQKAASASSTAKRGKAVPAAPVSSASVLDLGTGSGCIAVAVAAHLSGARVVAVDASPRALSVAKKNAAGAGVDGRVDFRQGDWFAGCRAGESFDFIVSNPPYLVDGDPAIWPEVSRYDPPAALYGGRDGLDCYRRIIPDAPLWLAPEGWILLEVGAGQAGLVADMLARRGFREVGIIADYGGVERVVKGKAPV